MGESGACSRMLVYVAHVERQGSKTRTHCDDSCHGTRHHVLMCLFSQRVDGALTTQPNEFNSITPMGKALFLTFIAEITILKVYVLCAFQFHCVRFSKPQQYQHLPFLLPMVH